MCKVIGILQSGADIGVQSYRENIGMLQSGADIRVQSYTENIGIRADNQGLHALKNKGFLQCSEEQEYVHCTVHTMYSRLV